MPSTAREARTVYRTEWFSVEEQTFDDPRLYGGRPYYRVRSPDGVLVLPVTHEGEFVLVRQFRPAIEQQSLEFPSGDMENGESPSDAAQRELHEETGYRSRQWRPLGVGRTLVNRHACKQHMFLALDAARDADHRPEPGIEVLTVGRRQLQNLVVSGDFQLMTALGMIVLSDWKYETSFAQREAKP